MRTRQQFGAAMLAAIFLASTIAPAIADPPPWAPAHGYRDKAHGKGKGRGGPKHRGGSYADYVIPFGIGTGRCNREEIGAVLGGALGGYAGSEIAKGDGRTAAIIGGTVLGAIVGGSLGRSMDEADHLCIGHTLEYAEEGRSVAWRDPDSGRLYETTPLETFQRDDGRFCREYRTAAMIGGQTREVYGTACRTADGAWQLLN